MPFGSYKPALMSVDRKTFRLIAGRDFRIPLIGYLTLLVVAPFATPTLVNGQQVPEMPTPTPSQRRLLVQRDVGPVVGFCVPVT